MMQENSRPLAILYGYRSNRNQLNFLGREGVVVLTGKIQQIQKILRSCNGLNSVEEIAQEVNEISKEEILGLLSLCEQRGVVQDSRELYLGFHRDSANIPMFSHDLDQNSVEKIMLANRLRKRNNKQLLSLPASVASNLLSTLHDRRSTRRFKPGSISREQLSGILKATYSIGNKKHWSVASGGGMYPLDIYLIIPDDKQEIPMGIYQWNPKTNTLGIISSEPTKLWLSKVFNVQSMLENASCILCVAAHFDRSAAKYANLAYRLVLLEAGHAIQNTSIFCAEQKIGAVECCGFADEMLANKLGLHFPHEAVISTLILGKIAMKNIEVLTTDQRMSGLSDHLRYTLGGDDKLITDVTLLDLKVGDYSMPQWAAAATYHAMPGHISAVAKKNSLVFGTGATSHEALVKTIAEGFERYALEQYRCDRNGSALDLPGPYLDPRVATPFTSTQYKSFSGLKPFDPKRKIDWVEGVRILTGKKVWIPTDLVYYAHKQNTSSSIPCYQASSSGVAAHTDQHIAVRTALYELIERDAFCVTWYSKRPVKAIRHELVSKEIQYRILQWKRLGYNVTILDISIDGPPVILALIWSRRKTPGLCSGAACRSTFSEAVSKAFDEAEFMAMSWHDYRPKRGMVMKDIQSPHDHGLYYVDPQNLTHVEWLLNSEEQGTLKDAPYTIDAFDPVSIDITPNGHSCTLKVVRVLSEKLMPINFGYGNEHRGHKRMEMLQFTWAKEYPSIPHFFA